MNDSCSSQASCGYACVVFIEYPAQASQAPEHRHLSAPVTQLWLAGEGYGVGLAVGFYLQLCKSCHLKLLHWQIAVE